MKFSKSSTNDDEKKDLITNDDQSVGVDLKETVLDREKTNNKSQTENRFDFLDGLRGSFAFIVTLSHSSPGINCAFIFLVTRLTQKYAIAGFFLLSAFLLTYRLIKDLYKPNSFIPLAVVQYFIRRFFRIYVVFALFVIAAKYGPRFIAGFTYGKYGNLTSILLLEYGGNTHLWTIPPEIKYYFLIPVISVVYYLAGRYGFIVFLCCAALSAHDQVYNDFRLSLNDIVNWSSQSYQLKSHFAVFFIGTNLAMAVHLTEGNEFLIKWLKNRKIQLLLSLISLLLTIYSLLYQTEIWNRKFDFK